jgi:hypothetical protein
VDELRYLPRQRLMPFDCRSDGRDQVTCVTVLRPVRNGSSAMDRRVTANQHARTCATETSTMTKKASSFHRSRRGHQTVSNGWILTLTSRKPEIEDQPHVSEDLEPPTSHSTSVFPSPTIPGVMPEPLIGLIMETQQSTYHHGITHRLEAHSTSIDTCARRLRRNILRFEALS